MKLDSTTYHYQAKPDGHTEWPVLPKSYSKTITFLPDNLSFDIHVTASGHVAAVNIHTSGPRVLKDGLSPHRVHQHYYNLSELPPFAIGYVQQALDLHNDSVIVRETP